MTRNLFDFDGVLADTEPVHHRAWNHTLKPLGIQLDWDYYRQNFVGISDIVALRDRLALSKLPIGTTWSLRNRLSFVRDWPRPQPFSGHRSMLRNCLGSYRLAVVSSSYKSEVEPPLVRAGIREYFQLLVTAEDVHHFKPSPEPYLLAAKKLGASRPLVIEDSDAGVASGQAAGFEVMRVSSVESVGREVLERLGLG